jgi:hypothetical protein
MVVQEPPRVPRQHENADGDDDAEHFREIMGKVRPAQMHQVEQTDDRDPDKHRPRPAQGG